MDRKPLPPPFPVGTRVRYNGTSAKCWRAEDPEQAMRNVPTLTEVEVVRAWHGHEAGDQRRECLDGWNVFDLSLDGTQFRGIIWPADAYEWEKIG